MLTAEWKEQTMAEKCRNVKWIDLKNLQVVAAELLLVVAEVLAVVAELVVLIAEVEVTEVVVAEFVFLRVLVVVMAFSLRE